MDGENTAQTARAGSLRPSEIRNEQSPEPGLPTTSAYHKVVIRKVDNGFIVGIGCREFVSKDWTALAVGLSDYWNDPVAAEKKYFG